MTSLKFFIFFLFTVSIEICYCKVTVTTPPPVEDVIAENPEKIVSSVPVSKIANSNYHLNTTLGRTATNSSDIPLPRMPPPYEMEERIGGCAISINDDLVDPQPILMRPGTEEFWIPDQNGIVYVRSGSVIELYCSESFRKPFTPRKFIQAVCLRGKTFTVKGEQYSFDEFACSANSLHTARRTGEVCYRGATKIEVGYDLGIRFLRTAEVCHDEVKQATLYVHHRLNPSSNSYQKSVPRPSFIEGDFYDGKDVNHLYSKNKQKDTFSRLLHGAHEKYFDDKKSYFIARGHLSAKADHIYGIQQRTTFYFVNAAPQWQRFNAGNWERIEDGVRRLVSERKIYVDCYTGTWGISELPDGNGVNQKLFLSVDEDENNNFTNLRIPIPKIYYRIVIERSSTKKGIVLIGVNNPHVTLEQIKKDYIVCNDISEKITWINWKKNDISSGYSYACKVEDFIKVVDHLPNLEVKGVLV